MPRTLKRRSDAISRDEQSPEPNDNRRSPSSSVNNSEASGSDSDSATDAASSTQTANIKTLTKKLVRLALSSEYARNPLRRTDIIQKVFKESNASPRLFKQVFAQTQQQLQSIWGMELLELPSREKTSLKDRRTQATQSNMSNTASQITSAAAANRSWILTSTLPQAYKTHPTIVQPAHAPSTTAESTYTALYTFILALVYLNNSCLSEAKMERYLKRVNADTYTPHGSLEKLLQRMIKEGYIEKRRDTTSGEEVVEYSPGPRGKVEVGVHGVAGLVRAVYGFGTVGLDGQILSTTTKTNTNRPQNNVAEDERASSDNEDNNENNNDNNNDNEENPDPASTTRTVKIDRDDLESRLKRSLGDAVEESSNTISGQDMMDLDGDVHTSSTAAAAEQPRRGGRRQRLRPDEDDD